MKRPLGNVEVEAEGFGEKLALGALDRSDVVSFGKSEELDLFGDGSVDFAKIEEDCVDEDAAGAKEVL